MSEGLTRGSPRLIVGGVLVLLTAVAGTSAVLGSLGSLGSGQVAASPSLAPTVEPLLPDLAGCPIPADLEASVRLAESSGGPDPNAAGGQIAICDRAGQLLGATASLTCVWAADRAHVRIVSGTVGNEAAPTSGASIRFEAKRPPELTVWLIDAAFRSDDPSLVGGSTPGSPSGVLGFRALPAVPRASARPSSVTAAGIVRWACNEAPDPIPGESTGIVRLDIDGSPSAARVAEGTCRWATIDGTSRMRYLETYTTAMRIDGVETGLSLNATDRRDQPVEAVIYLTDPIDSGGRMVSGPYAFPIDVPGDLGRGTVRFRRFALVDGRPPGSLPSIGAGTVSWLCDPPIVAGPHQSADPPRELPTREGIGIIRLGYPLDEELPATVICSIGDPDPNNPAAGSTTPQAEPILMEALYLDERLILTSELGGAVVLERLGPGGRVLGEYVAIDRSGSWGWQDADLGPYRVPMGRLAFEPTDRGYLPLGGPGGPERFELSVTVDCRAP